MSLRVVTMSELRLEVLLEPERTGQSVVEVCRRRGISRETFYEYRRRYENEGPPVSNLGPVTLQRPRPRSTPIWRWRSGRGYIECHHVRPLAAAQGEVRTRLADLAVVCCNCHRILHRGSPPPSVRALHDRVS